MKSVSLKKNAVYSLIKTGCSIMFPLITFPYVTRVLSTDNYGKYTFSASIIGYIALIAGLGIANYARREGARVRDDRELLQKFVSEVFSIHILSTLAAIVILFLLLVFWPKLHDYSSVIVILSLSTIFTTLGTDWINTIFEDYRYITIRYLICQIISIGLMFAIVREPNDVINYAVVTVSGGVLANISNIFYIRKKYRLTPKIVFTKNLENHLKPVLVLFATTIVSVIYINSDITILGMLSSDTDVAIYGVSSKIYSLAKQMINSIAAVTISRISLLVAKNATDSIKRIIENTFEAVLLFLIPSVVGLILLRDPIILLISGEKYLNASMSLMILSCSLLCSTMANIFVNTILIPYRKENISFLILSLSAVINIVLNFILIPRFTYNAAAFTTLISEFFVLVFSFIVSRKILSVDILKKITLPLVGGGIAVISCVTVLHFFSKPIVVLSLSISLTVVFYLLLLMLVKDNPVYIFVNRILKRKK